MSLSISYLAATIAFLVISILAATLWRGRLQGWWLVAALFASSIWAGYTSVSFSGQFNPSNQTFIEIVRGLCWIGLLWRLLDELYAVQQKRIPARYGYWLLSFAMFALIGNLTFPLLGWFEGEALSRIRWSLLLGINLLALIMLEQWYRMVPIELRWCIKLLAIALLLFFCADIFLYSSALLLGGLHPTIWVARGWLAFLLVPLIAISVGRSEQWNLPSRLSHQALFYSATLVLAGIYLLLMSVVGYFMRWFGTGFGSALQTLFIVGALVLLIVVFSSGRYRSLLTLWLNKHFLAYRYDYREEWMRANSRFADLQLDNSYYDQLLLGIAEPLDSPGGVIWVAEGPEWPVKSCWGHTRESVLIPDLHVDLFRFFVRSGWIIDVQEYKAQPGRYSECQLDESWLSSDHWVLVPLLHQQQLYGLVALAPPRTQRPLSWEDRDLLKALASQVAALLALRSVTESLSEARQFEAFNQLSAFVVHDIKNIVAQLSMVVKNAEKYRDNPEFVDDALETLEHAVGRMNRMLAQLRTVENPLVHKRINLLPMLDKLAVRHATRKPVPKVVSDDTEIVLFSDPDRLEAVISHLIENAQDATPSEGQIIIRVDQNEDQLTLTVEDSGSGMDSEFIRNGLFKPFVTTKGRAGMGIGVFEARQFAHSSGGSLNVDSQLGRGSRFMLRLPLSPNYGKGDLA